ncbi:glycosyltransferase [Echinicola vietnamensis DSM 17526]|uniref:Glycosyltransferase n=2 Tax=Echinicola TaxID=390846 RepID=L0G4W6_ECHVK|nr:glycosyltransferase [Echinicola vietnamensis DSM 17526]
MSNVMSKNILLVSFVVSNKGHGREYLTNIANLTSKSSNVSVFVPSDTDLQKELSSEITVYKSRYGYGAIEREKYKKYGKLSQVIRGGARVRDSLSIYKDLISLIKKSDFDIIHILDSEYISLLSFLNSINEEGKIYITLHASDFYFNSFTFGSIYKSCIRKLLNRSFNKVNGVICHGDWIKDRLQKSFPSVSERILALNYPSQVYKNLSSKSLIRENLRIPKDKTLVLFIGMIRRDKRIEIALETISLLSEEYCLLIAGNPTDYSLSDIDYLIDKYKVGHKVVTDLGFLQKNKFEEYFSISDVLLSCHSKTFPSASGPVSDARTYGLPVVVSPGGQLQYYVESSKVGVVSNGFAAKDYARAIEVIKGEKNQIRESIVEASREYSWDSFVNRQVNFY